MEQELAAAIAELLETFVQAKDFVLAQAPVVVQELLRWKFWEHLLLLIVLIPVGGLIAFFGAMISSDWEAEIPGIVMFALGVVMVAIGLGNAFSLLKLHLAPTVYLMEYAAKLAGG